jgi:hypothetical protein
MGGCVIDGGGGRLRRDGAMFAGGLGVPGGWWDVIGVSGELDFKEVIEVEATSLMSIMVLSEVSSLHLRKIAVRFQGGVHI